MAEATLDTHWQAAFPSRSRPKLYSGEAPRIGEGFRPLTDTSDFLVDNLQSLTKAQLYTLTENNALALRLAQEEWIALERIAQQIKTRDALPATIRDPQLLPSREIFEERKEAAVYSYKYEGNRKILPARFTVPEQITDQEKFDCREPPEPFAQAGLIPNEKQHRAIMVAARNEGREKNPDNQQSYKENFAFEPFTSGTWIAKMLPPELPPPPRTRARNAILNGTAERQTRFNGEKVPMTRQLSSNTVDTASPGKRTGTPFGGQSPALGKRKIDATDITANITRKKHPNQYTKAKEERERLAREAALKAAGIEPSAIVNGEVTAPSSLPAPVKKKHPNQYTKRREREEEERRRREDEEARVRELAAQSPSVNEVPRPYWHPAVSRPMVEQPFQTAPYRLQPIYPGTHPFPESMSQFQYPSYTPNGPSNLQQQVLPNRAPERPKHPNQHTKRREREAAEAAAIALEHVMSGTPGPPPNGRTNGAGNFGVPRVFQMATSRQSTPLSQPLPTSQSTKGRDPATMTKEELRFHPFKDHELIAFLQKDHTWLNEDPETAETWKRRILASDYPVRTWAMFRKWREWRSDGKDKRPRDKDGKRIKQTQPVVIPTEIPATAVAVFQEPKDVMMADVNHEIQSNRSILAGSKPAQLDNNFASLPTSPVKQMRPFRTRLDTGRIGSPYPQMPGSPLVNGINARDLDESLPSPSTAADAEAPFHVTEAQATSFKQRLSSFHEVDPATKVNTWQDKSETDYSASTYAGKGALRQRPPAQRALRSTNPSSKAQSQVISADDVSEPNAPDHNVSRGLIENGNPPKALRQGSGKTSSTAEDDSNPDMESSSASSESNDEDGEYGSRTRVRKRVRHTKRARVATRAAPATTTMERTISTRSARSTRDKISTPQDYSHNQSSNGLLLTRTRSGEQSRTRSERTTSPTVSRRVGLRPGLPKRTFTEDSEVTEESDGGVLPARRSLRSTNVGGGDDGL